MSKESQCVAFYNSYFLYVHDYSIERFYLEKREGKERAVLSAHMTAKEAVSALLNLLYNNA